MSPTSMLNAIITGYVPPFRVISRYVHCTEGIKGKCNNDPDPEDDEVETEKAKVMPSPNSYAHMLSKKEENIARILDAIAAGHRTQPAIRKVTGISESTISIRCRHLIALEEIEINKLVCPWVYSIKQRSA